MNNGKSRMIAINGILIALMIVMTITMFFTGGMAFLPLTVLVVGMVIMGKWTALILGFTFGLLSLISAFIFPSPTAPLFQNPLVSLLPRIVSALCAYGVYCLSDLAIKKLDAKRKKPLNEYVKKSISTALGAIFVVFFNTLFVLSMIWILYNGKTLGSVFINKAFVMGLITINFLVEIIVTPILSMPVAIAVEKFLKKNKKQVLTNEDIRLLDSEAENAEILIEDNVFCASGDEKSTQMQNNIEVKASDNIENNGGLIGTEVDFGANAEKNSLDKKGE